MDQKILKLVILDGYTEVVAVFWLGWVVWTDGKDMSYSQGRPLRGG